MAGRSRSLAATLFFEAQPLAADKAPHRPIVDLQPALGQLGHQAAKREVAPRRPLAQPRLVRASDQPRPAKVPHGHWKTMTFLAGLRSDRIVAPWVVDGPINGESFRIYVERVLVPTLAPGDIVVMDNLGSHKGPAIRAAIRRAGAKLFYLPPYSPDLNPIEQMFAKLKHLLRKAAERTVETTWRRIGDLLDRFTAQECANYLVNSGYAST